MPLTAHIDLTKKTIEVLPTDPDLLQRWLGGRGLGAALLNINVGLEDDPLSPENCLIFTTALFNGTSWPTASRYHVTFKSPATGGYGYANSGGHFSSELRRAGFTALIISGKADKPVVLKIIDERIELVSAQGLWGLPTSEVIETLSKEGGRVAAIGLAGENMVPMAAIINDGGRAAARGGPGAVMGSKKLKAIHVRATQRNVPVPSALSPITKELSQRLLDNPDTRALKEESTLFLMSFKNQSGDLPAKNHQTAQVPFIDNLDAKAFAAYWSEQKGCSACPIRCARNSTLEVGDGTIVIEGPEYETTDAFGPMCWNDDPEVVIKANHLCNEFGLDTISTGVTIAFAMECRQRGFLEDDEFSLEWGDQNTILGLIERIARREGLGSILARGVRQAARQIGNGAEEIAMHVKGLEIPRQEPRIAKAFGLGHATSNRGADHLYALPTLDLAGNWEAARKFFAETILTRLMDTADEAYKPDLVILSEHFSAVADSLGVCKFSTCESYAVLPDDLARGLQALGFDYSGEDLLAIGERIVNLERMINVRHGFSRDDDKLPRRFSDEPLDVYEYRKDPNTGQRRRSESPITRGVLEDFDAMLSRYYELRGWDEDGIPTPETLQRLDVELPWDADHEL